MGFVVTDWLLIGLVLLSLLPWGALIVIAWVFLKALGRCLKANEELTAQVVGLKNPWAAAAWHATQQDQGQGSVVGAGYEPEAYEQPI